MPNISVSTFLASENRVLAASYALLIEALCRGEDGGNLYRPDLLEWIEQGVICHVAEYLDAPKVIAGAAVVPDGSTAILTAVGVHPDGRGLGIGGKLMTRLIDDCEARGFKHITLDIRLYDDGLPEAPYRLYHAFGFRMVSGIKVTPIGWGPKCSHLWLHRPDPGGVFRSRVMSLDLMPSTTQPMPDPGEADDAA